jgi:tetratricopeptide (TPR) repeat protein
LSNIKNLIVLICVATLIAAAAGCGGSQSNLDRAKLALGRRQFAKAIEALREAPPEVRNGYTAQMLLGDAYMGNSELDKSEEAFNAAAKASPKRVEPVLGVVRVIRQRLRTAQTETEKARFRVEAIQKCQNALALDDKAPKAWAMLAMLHQDSKELKEAREALRKASECDPKNPTYKLDLARLLIEDGEPKEAEQLVDAALAQDADLGFARLLKSHLLHYTHADKDGAIEQLLLAVDAKKMGVEQRGMALARLAPLLLGTNRLDEALKYAKKLKEFNPYRGLALKLMSSVYIRQDQPQKAYEVLKIMEKVPRADIQMPLGAVEEQLGMINSAIGRYRHIINEIDPKHVYANLALARLTFNRRLYAESKERCTTVLKERPGHPGALRILARIYRAPGAQRNFELARWCYMQLLSRGKDSDVVLLDLAGLHLDMNRPGLAISTGERARSTKDSARARLVIGQGYLQLYNRVGRSAAAEANKHLASALDHLRRAKALEPANAQIALWLARVHLARKKPNEAVNELRPFISQNPTMGQAYLALSSVYESKGEMDKAVKVLENASNVRGIKNFSKTALGRAYFLDKRLDMAIDVWQKYEIEAKSEQTDLGVTVGLAVALALKGQYDKAINRAEQIVHRAGKSGAGPLVAACIAIGNAKYGRAKTYLAKRIYPSPKEKAEYLKFPDICKAAGENGKKAATLIAESILHNEFRSPVAAIDRLEQAIKLIPKSIVPRYTLGQALRRARRFKDIPAVYEQIFKDFPSLGYPHFELARQVGPMMKPDEIRQKIELSLDLDGDIAAARIALAHILLADSAKSPDVKLLEAAVKHADRAVELDGGTIRSLEVGAQAHSAMAQYHFTQVMEEKDPAERKIKSLRRVASQKKVDAALQKLSDKFPNSLAVLMGRMRAYISRGKYAAAIGLGLGFLERQQREIPGVRRLVAASYLRNNQPVKAQQQLVILLRYNPTDIAARLMLADAYARQHRPVRVLGELQNANRAEPNNIQVLMALGTAYLKYGRAEDAKALYESLTGRFPANATNPRARAVRGVVLIGLATSLLDIETADLSQRAKNLDQALNHLAPMVDPPAGSKPNVRAMLLAGRIMEAKKLPLKASEMYKRTIQTNPRFAPAYNALGVLYYQGRQFDTAITMYAKTVIPTWKYDAGAYARLALLHLARGRTNDARDAAAMSAKVMDFLKMASKNVAASERLEEHFRAVRIVSLIAARKPADARSEIKRIRTMEAGTRESYLALVDACRDATKSRALARHQGAMLFYRGANKSGRAIAAAEQAAAAFPTNLFLLAQLTDLYLVGDDHASYAKTLQRILTLAENSPRLIEPREHEKLYVTLAKTYLDHLRSTDPKAVEKATAVYSKGLKKWPQSVNLLFQKARIEESLKQYTAAMKTLEAIITLSGQGTPQWLRAKKSLTMQYYQTGRVAKAAQTFDETEKFIQKDALWLNNGGWFHATKVPPDFKRATELAEKAKEQASSNPQIRDTLGWIYHMRGIYYKAKPELTYAARVLPNDANVLHHLGANQMKTNEMAEAVKSLRRAIQLSREGRPLRDAGKCNSLLKEAERRLGAG